MLIVSGRQGLSRAKRRDNATAWLYAAVAAIEKEEDRLEDLDQKDFTLEEFDVEAAKEGMTELKETLQEAIDAAEDCEFPGMFG